MRNISGITINSKIDYKELICQAISARENSYSPYSNFMVGAALLTADGKVYKGCNIENAAYTPSSCAERTAFFSAVNAGHRKFIAIAVVGKAKDGKQGFAYPCGVCRQVMMEFCDPDKFIVITAAGEEDYKVAVLKELIPDGFGPANLAK